MRNNSGENKTLDSRERENNKTNKKQKLENEDNIKV